MDPKNSSEEDDANRAKEKAHLEEALRTASVKHYGALPSMEGAVRMVEEFHGLTGQPVYRRWTPIDPARVRLRMRLKAEETCELFEAVFGKDHPKMVNLRKQFAVVVETMELSMNSVDVSHELIDDLYVTIGMGLELGVPVAAVFAEVHRANMQKRDPATGKVSMQPDGKVNKPPGWVRADVAKCLLNARLANPIEGE